MSNLVLQVLDDFSKQVDRIDWPVGSPATIHYTALDGYLSTYQVGAQSLTAGRGDFLTALVWARGSRGLREDLGPGTWVPSRLLLLSRLQAARARVSSWRGFEL